MACFPSLVWHPYSGGTSYNFWIKITPAKTRGMYGATVCENFIILTSTVFSSFHELIQSRGVRRLTVRPSVCKLLRKSLLLAGKWLDRHQTCTRWTPGQRASRVCSRSRSMSKVTWYGHFCAGTKIASSRGQIARSPPNLQSMVSRKAWPKFWVRLSRGNGYS